MKKAALIVVIMFAAACGGGKKAPAKPADTGTSEHATAETTPPPGDTTPPPADKPAEPAKPAGPSPEELAKQAATEQVDQGGKLWKDKGCAKCHGENGEGTKTSPALVGDKALPEKAPKTAKLRKGVAFKNAKDVMDFTKKHMPKGKEAGKLTDDEVAALTAWVMTQNKVTLDKKLDADSAMAMNIPRAAAAEPAEKPEKPAKGKTPAKPPAEKK